jgi:glyoxylase-like metal-dependent hydrolase (beta-lactamase superfamily II)/ferredoxin
MARLQDRLPQNVDGELYVDSSCIDCETCRFVAPHTFDRSDAVDQSYVARQPDSEEDRIRALMALVACPTSSIGTRDKADLRAAVDAFPEEIAEGVHYCGFASEDSFGASSYLLVRAPGEGGNVLVDSPRAAKPLMRRIESLGSVSTMFLTHRDDVADHAQFHARFGCQRVMHRRDLSHSTAAVERPVDGEEPVRLDDDLVIIPVAGHTRGSAALLYRERFLFTGDHLWWSKARNALHASRSVCWYSWEEQTRSMARLLDFRFEWVLPGHGRRFRAASPQAMREELERLVRWMRTR